MSMERVSRADAFAQAPALARSLYDWQASSFNPDEDPFEAGEEVFLNMDDEAPTVLSAEEAARLNQEHADFCAAMRDPFGPPPPELGRAEFLIGELPCADIADFMAEIGSRTARLCETMGWGTLFILPYVRAPILSQENDYEQAEQACAQLIGLGLPRDYSEALALAPADITDVCAPLFRIARYNASAPYIAMGAAGSAAAITFCKYGNYHFDTYEKAEHARLTDALAQTGFEVPEDGMCRERFSETGAIEGRRIDIG